MRVQIDETDVRFYMTLTPDTHEDASLLVRMALNTKRVPAHVACAAYPKSVCGSVILERRADTTSFVGRGR